MEGTGATHVQPGVPGLTSRPVALPGGRPATLIHVATGKDEVWTVVESRVPEAIGFVPSLSCMPKGVGGRAPLVAPQELRRDVRHESVAFASRYAASVAQDQEENWLLQLLSPSFADWLATSAHAELGFELHEGTLRCIRPGRIEAADAGPFLAETDRVLTRIAEEVAESEGLGVRDLGLGIPERVSRAVERIGPLPALPPDSRHAAKPFRRFAARDPRPYIAALGGVLSAFTLVAGALFYVIDYDLIDLLAAFFGWIGLEGTGYVIGGIALVGWIAAIPEAIAIAARPYGRAAFAREYARARRLELESPQSFHRRFMRVELIAPAQFVLRGELDGDEMRIVLCRSATRLFHTYGEALVLTPSLPSGHAGPGQGWQLTDGVLHRSRGSDGNHSAAGLDAFVASARAERDRLRRPQTETSSTSPTGS